MHTQLNQPVMMLLLEVWKCFVLVNVGITGGIAGICLCASKFYCTPASAQSKVMPRRYADKTSCCSLRLALLVHVPDMSCIVLGINIQA